MKLTTLLRRARARSGLSLSKAASEIGITKSHLHDLEHSGRQDNPTLRVIAAICRVYGITPDQIIETAKGAQKS